MLNFLKFIFPDFTFYFGGGGGGGGQQQPRETVQTQTSIPEYAKPYVEKMLGKTEALTKTPYQAYGGERIAGFTPLQNQAFQGVQNMQPSQQLGIATQMAGLAGLNAANINYQGGNFTNQFQAPANFSAGSFANRYQSPAQFQAREYASQYQRPDSFQSGEFQGQYQRPDSFQAGSFTNQYRGPQDYQAGSFGTAGVSAPSLQQFQMGAPERVGVGSFARPGAAEEFMSPYQQAVTDIEKREATRASNIMGQQQQAQAAQRGAFGGSRSALIEAERQRNLGIQLGDIQARGSQNAFQQAREQFNAENLQAGLQAQLANQQAGLTAGGQNLSALLGVQQLGAGQNLQSQLANQQAAMEAQRLGEQSRQYGYGQGMTRSQLEAQYGTEAQRLAEQSRQYGYGQDMAAAQLGAQYDTEAQRMREQSRQYGFGQDMTAAQLAAQYGTEAQRLGEQSRQYGYGQGMTSAQLGAQYGTEADRLAEQSRQYGYGQSMTGAQLGAQYGTEAQRMAEQSRQFGAGYGMQGIQQLLAAAGQLGGLGQTQFGQQKDILQGQLSAGAQQRDLEQQRLLQFYQDFQNQRQYPYQQLSFMSDMLRGLPLSQYSQQMYSAPPSFGAQVAGAGMGLLGAKQAGLFGAAGGSVPGGLARVAANKLAQG
jgi:hypothetical protein